MTLSELLEKGLIFFAAGQYFEAHEVWEDLWRMTEGPMKVFYQGLIQTAVALHHLERANLIGAKGQLTKAISHLLESPSNPHSIDTSDLIRQLRAVHTAMKPATVRIARLK